jgi:AhpD family alkylhydroperoxidase
MQQRLSSLQERQNAALALRGLGDYLERSSLKKNLLDLVCFRVSQINGCAFCLDMHAKDLRAAGESEQRLYMMDAWREAPFYSDRERAALLWAEAVTQVNEGHVPDDLYEEARRQFSEKELVELTLAVIAINSYNRLNIAFRTPAGGYQPGQFASRAKQHTSEPL